jgi:hypothetical protein
MRGIFLIGALIALAIVGYLHVKSANTALESDTAKNKMEEVQQQVDTSIQEHMDNLQQQIQQQSQQ